MIHPTGCDVVTIYPVARVVGEEALVEASRP
jgi:hypothetical protein